MKRTQLLILILAIALAAIIMRWYEPGSSSPITIPQNAVVYTDEAAMELLQDESLWAMPDLLQAEVYLLNEEINIDFWFDKKADNHQINNARGFVISSFVLRNPMWLGASPYSSIIAGKDSKVEWQTVSCRVYQGRKLLYHERYDEHYQLIK